MERQAYVDPLTVDVENYGELHRTDGEFQPRKLRNSLPITTTSYSIDY